MTTPLGEFATKPLTPETWADFAALVEANNGVWGGCWCIGFHPDCFQGSAAGNRDAKRAHVEDGTVHQILVYLDGECVGWCQYGPTAEVARIKNPKAYEKERVDLPDWRVGCVFTGGGHRRHGVARAARAAVLGAISAAGGGVVEAYPEQLDGAARSEAPTCTPVRRACSESSASFVTVASPSGAGSCASASRVTRLFRRLDRLLSFSKRE